MYTKDKILLLCDKALKDIKNFYKQDFINFWGVSSDTKEFYTEIIAEYVTKHIEEFQNNIPVITRKECYKTDSHKDEYNKNSNRTEEITAIKMFNQSNLGNYNLSAAPLVYRNAGRSSATKNTYGDA